MQKSEVLDLSVVQCQINQPFNGESDLSLITTLGPRKVFNKIRTPNQKGISSKEDSLNDITIVKKDCREDPEIKTHFPTPSTHINLHHSDEESDGNDLLQPSESYAMDDTFVVFKPKYKISYLNVIVVGASKSGKSDFTKFLFQECFQRKCHMDSKETRFHEFIHKIDCDRRGPRILTFIHSKGFSHDYPMSEWYSSLKGLLLEKMNNYQQMREFSLQNKSLQQSSL